MSEKRRVLIVEDEADLAELLKFNLEREGYKCRCVANGDAALAALRDEPPDVIILDRMLPGLSGDQFIGELRRGRKTAGIPTIMLTAKAEESDELVGFALGADDYVTKPFSMKLLLARVDAVLRRAGAAVASDVFSAGPITVDRDRHEVTVNNKAITLTSTEFGILWELAAARGGVLTRDRLIDAVRGVKAAVTDRTIDVHIAALRKKLGDAANLIQTVRGVGYVLRSCPGDDS